MSVLKNNDIKISIDGKGIWGGNAYVERLWRSVRYEEVYLRIYDNFAEEKCSLGDYFEVCNKKRRHQSLEKQASDTVYNKAVVRIAA